VSNAALFAGQRVVVEGTTDEGDAEGDTDSVVYCARPAGSAG
jgi:hypothetical protein